MKKVLLISNNGLGFYNFKKELVEKLLDLNYEVHFAVPAYEKLSELVLKGAFYHELYIDRRGINPIKDMALINQFRRLMNNVKPGIVILHTIKPNIYASLIAKQRRIPYINNITGLGSALQNSSKLARILRFLYRLSLSKSNGIFFENIGNEEYFKKYEIGNPNKHIVVSGAGVNLNYYLPIPKKRSTNITFLYIARIMKEKGIEEYLDSAVIINDIHHNVKFQILGWFDETIYKSRIDSLIDKGVVEYLGVLQDTRVAMSHADCVVLPSYHEGMSNVLLEGASCGLPLITTNIPGCREAVEDGKTGYLCEKRDVESLSQAMRKFISLSPDEREQMGIRGRIKMQKEFNRNIIVSQYVKCVEENIK